MGSDGAAGSLLGPHRVPTGPPAAPGAVVGALGVCILVVHQYDTVEWSVRAYRGLSRHIGFPWASVGTLI